MAAVAILGQRLSRQRLRHMGQGFPQLQVRRKHNSPWSRQLPEPVGEGAVYIQQSGDQLERRAAPAAREGTVMPPSSSGTFMIRGGNCSWYCNNFECGSMAPSSRMTGALLPGSHSTWGFGTTFTCHGRRKTIIFPPLIPEVPNILDGGQVIIAGQDGWSRSIVDPEYNHFQPRFGFAATLGKGLVLRGGFGMSYYVTQATFAVYDEKPAISRELACEYGSGGHHPADISARVSRRRGRRAPAWLPRAATHRSLPFRWRTHWITKTSKSINSI